MKKHTPKQYAIALYETTKNLNGEVLDAAVKGFAQILWRERAVRFLDGIIREFELYEKKQRGDVTLQVRSANELSKTVKKFLLETFGSTEIEEVIDPTVIGGLTVRAGDTVYDGSVRTQLTKLRGALLNT